VPDSVYKAKVGLFMVGRSVGPVASFAWYVWLTDTSVHFDS
jgi:hypothetical protein